MSDLRDALKRSIAELEYCRDHAYSPDVTTIKRLKSIAALAQPEAVEPVALVWRDGAPPKPWADEWFIARTTFNDRVVLTALPEEYSYDFKTADDTYIKADRIKQWMQFPDSQFIAPPLAPDGERMRRVLETRAEEIRSDNQKYGWTPDGQAWHRAFGELAGINFALKALSRADEGKESDGGETPSVFDECIASGRSCEYERNGPRGEQQCKHCGTAPSDPTPPDATAQREAIARIIRCTVYGCEDRWSGISGEYQAADAILALTRAGG